VKLDSLLIQLQSWAQAEVAAQARLSTILDDLLEAVRASGTELLVDAGGRLEVALESGPARETRRRELMASFAGVFGVPGETLSLTSILQRARESGAEVQSLEAVRGELRAIVKDVARRARLLVATAGHHRGVLSELLTIIGGSARDEEARSAGVLVDAEA
jgi:hypothetical protein